jgi:hypothetical protein
MNTGTEQQTQLADIQMSMNPTPAARLEMVHTQFLFGQLETLFDGPPGKSYP